MKTPDFTSDFTKYFSSARVIRYLAATGNNSARAQKLYKANLRVAQSFHPLLSIIEVVLRNRINDILTAYFTDPDWIINQKNGFMSDPKLTYIHKQSGKQKTNNFLFREVDKAEKRIRKTGASVTHGKIISEVPLGFWTIFFDTNYFLILKGRPIQIFSSLPNSYRRKAVKFELEKIRLFRNRINHNEPICFDGNIINFKKAEDVYVSLMNILRWIDPGILNYIKDIDRVQQKIAQAQKI